LGEPISVNVGRDHREGGLKMQEGELGKKKKGSEN